MLNYLSQLLIQLEEWINKFFGFDSQSSGSWQSQTMPRAGGFGTGQARSNSTHYGARAATEHKKYTPEEVKRCLRGLEKGERVGPVLAEAGQVSAMLNESMRRHFRGRERIFDRLPYVLYQYTQGRPSHEIARSVSYFSDGDDVEEAMYFVARLITARVNRTR